MTCLIREGAASTLNEGIETVLIPIRHPSDIESLVFHSQRGGTYDVVEWLLSQLHRDSDLERVCGLDIRQSDRLVVAELQLRQPGKQLEIWLEQQPDYHLILHRAYEAGPIEVRAQLPSGFTMPVGKLSGRSISKAKFTDTHQPWWKDEQALVQPDGTTLPEG